MSNPTAQDVFAIYQDVWTALDHAYGGKAPNATILRLNRLLSDLACADVASWAGKAPSRNRDVAYELLRYQERVKARKNSSQQVTLKGFLRLSEEAQNIVGSMLAIELSGIVDNFAQINFDHPDHYQALISAASRAHSWISEPLGRPKRTYLNDYFTGVIALFQQIPNANLSVSNHYNGQPQSPFEIVLHAGHRMIGQSVSYYATVKAYQRL